MSESTQAEDEGASNRCAEAGPPNNALQLTPAWQGEAMYMRALVFIAIIVALPTAAEPGQPSITNLPRLRTR